MLETLIVINPLLGFLVVGFVHSLYRNKYIKTLKSLNFVVYIAILLLLLNVIVVYYMFINKFLFNGQFSEITGFSYWIDISVLKIQWGLLYDSITIVMLVLINTVSFVVHVYSLNYMLHDPYRTRFISYLSLFTFFMIVLVTASNFVQLFIGWEGVGLCSYLLINFWYTRIQANKAAIKAMLVNKVSDLFIILGVVMFYYLCGSLDYKVVFNMIPILVENPETINYLTIASIALVIGGIGKSAQIGLHTWLADAMEGPTPVSALIHAATMVTAGVFLLARCSPILEFLPDVLRFVAFIGILTAFLGSLMALAQSDIKKIIAYSTCSQLGYMFFACGCSLYHLGLFHLLTHGFFKALLFLCAGSIIHFFRDEQDIRRMGGFLYLLPVTYVMFLFANLSLAGFPFLAGYYSKEGILLSSMMYFSYFNYGTIMFWMGAITALLTAVYSMRSLVIVFLSQVSVRPIFKNKVLLSIEHLSMDHVVLFILYVGAIVSGYLLMDPLIGVGSLFWGNSIHLGISSYSSHQFIAEFLNFKSSLSWLSMDNISLSEEAVNLIDNTTTAPSLSFLEIDKEAEKRLIKIMKEFYTPHETSQVFKQLEISKSVKMDPFLCNNILNELKKDPACAQVFNYISNICK